MSIRFLAITAAAGLSFVIQTSAGANSTPRAYPDDLKMAMKIGNALYDSLDAKYQQSLEPTPVRLLPMDAPKMTPTENDNLGQVSVSVGFVVLMDRIAHAKAIDQVKRGYFDKYVSSLEQGSDENPPELPDIDNPRYWQRDVMNDQSGFFNQMMGLTMAINLSHHYLGQYDKYSGQMSGELAPINNFLTMDEWETGLKAAAENSLECAFSTAGGKALFEAIGKMPHRPAWAAYIVPQNVDVKKLNKQLAKYEKQFFHGRFFHRSGQVIWGQRLN
ncbi:MAG TPA: hypothetical protein VFC44_17060 [Candidatus Saccharimonadales bacterium]|nr:hypothetical protein [Candidatus Saccharimonadales bacterium]